MLSESIDAKKIVELWALPQYDSKHIAAMGYISGSITDISSLATRGNNICTFLHHLKLYESVRSISPLCPVWRV